MFGDEQTNFANRNPVPRAEAIARLNDKLRTTCRGGHIMSNTRGQFSGRLQRSRADGWRTGL